MSRSQPVIASAAKQSRTRRPQRLSCSAKAEHPVHRGLSVQSLASLEYWIPAFAGMTTECDFTFSRRVAPEVCIPFVPPQNQRAQGRPGARCTRGLACNCAQRTRTRAYRFSGNTPAFPAQWLDGLLRALPGERLFCLRRCANLSTQLDASTAAPGPHDFAVRLTRARLAHASRPPHLTARS